MLNYEQFAENINEFWDDQKHSLRPQLCNDGEFVAIPFDCLSQVFPLGFVDFEHTILSRICDGYIAINTYILADALNVEADDIKKLFE